jgi:antitoxin FitA
LHCWCDAEHPDQESSGAHAAVLRRRAAAARLSLQEYLLRLLIDEADRLTLDEVLDSAGSRTGTSISFGEINAVIRRDRDSH